MAGGRPSFEKREREKAKRAKAQGKRERRAERAEADAPEPSPDQLSEDELVARLRTLQERLDAGQLDLEAFQSEREALMERFQV